MITRQEREDLLDAIGELEDAAAKDLVESDNRDTYRDTYKRVLRTVDDLTDWSTEPAEPVQT